MKITRARVHPFTLALREPLSSARGPIHARRGALLELECAGGELGLGEATPIEGFGLESVGEAREQLAALAERALGTDPRAPGALLEFAARRAGRCAYAALESALLELAARAENLSLAAFLARPSGRTPRAAIALSALLSGGSTAEVAESARVARKAGYGCAKLKVGGRALDLDVARVAAAREALGPELRLRLDANGAWPDAARAHAALARFLPFALEMVEQPVPAESVEALGELCTHEPVAIAADEAISDPRGLERVLEARSADVAVLKVAPLGGLRAALAAGERAAEAGLALVVTSTLDGAVGRAGALALAAALPEPLFACGLATGPLLADDFAPREVLESGAYRVSREPGLGVALDREALRRLADPT